MKIDTITLDYNSTPINIDFFERPGEKGIILFLHGLGGAKENFEWAFKHPALRNYTLLAFDNPGTGNSTYPDTGLNIDDLVDITNLFIESKIKDKFFLSGASMGGLTMLNYVKKYGTEQLKGIINIEGNLKPEDCLFSGKVISFKEPYFVEVEFDNVIQEMRQNPTCGYHSIANNLELNTDRSSYYNYSFQTVEYSADGSLYDNFVALDLPRIFLHGDRNRSLSYIPDLHNTNVQVEEISGSDHFLFYDNPKELFGSIGEFVTANI